MREKDFDQFDTPREPFDLKGTMEIEYTIAPDWIVGTVDLKCTISYRVWQTEPKGAIAEYSIVGSANYLPKDFNRLVQDYLIELDELKNVSIYECKQVTK